MVRKQAAGIGSRVGVRTVISTALEEQKQSLNLILEIRNKIGAEN